MDMDVVKLAAARKYLGANSDTETIDWALLRQRAARTTSC